MILCPDCLDHVFAMSNIPTNFFPFQEQTKSLQSDLYRMRQKRAVMKKVWNRNKSGAMLAQEKQLSPSIPPEHLFF